MIEGGVVLGVGLERGSGLGDFSRDSCVFGGERGDGDVLGDRVASRGRGTSKVALRSLRIVGFGVGSGSGEDLREGLGRASGFGEGVRVTHSWASGSRYGRDGASCQSSFVIIVWVRPSLPGRGVDRTRFERREGVRGNSVADSESFVGVDINSGVVARKELDLVGGEDTGGDGEGVFVVGEWEGIRVNFGRWDAGFWLGGGFWLGFW
jgi:hypothetical protein